MQGRRGQEAGLCVHIPYATVQEHSDCCRRCSASHVEQSACWAMRAAALHAPTVQ